MPELPEVETTKRGISPHLVNQIVDHVVIRQWQLRWPIPVSLPEQLHNQQIIAVERRAKYLLIHFQHGILMIHLGMSGCLRILQQQEPHAKHDHVDIILHNQMLLRYTDPRRFGSFHWLPLENWQQHPLLKQLGPEPLAHDFNANYLWQQCQKRRIDIKKLLMDNHVVVGVGNIYATESLFLAGIHPSTACHTLTQQQCQTLYQHVQQILQHAIQQGGTTLRDFVNSEGKPGYFSQQLWVYGRKDQACLRCGNTIQVIKQAQRTTSYCPQCQPKQH